MENFINDLEDEIVEILSENTLDYVVEKFPENLSSEYKLTSETGAILVAYSGDNIAQATIGTTLINHVFSVIIYSRNLRSSDGIYAALIEVRDLLHKYSYTYEGTQSPFFDKGVWTYVMNFSKRSFNV